MTVTAQSVLFRRLARGVTALLAVGALVACGPGGGDQTGKPGPASASSAALVPPGDGGAGAGFPTDVPVIDDGECERPQVDPARPRLGPDGKPTDGVRVTAVKVVDDGADGVLVSFSVTARPVIEAESGERWVVVELQGVRGVPPGEPTMLSSHARPLTAKFCDDSAYGFAVALDRPVARLTLADTAPGQLGLRIGLAPPG